MTYLKDTFGRDMFRELERSFVGFDRVFDTISKTQSQMLKTAQSFPFYNIRKDSDTKYTIELAVAGFGKQDIEIGLEEDKLTIKGAVKDDPDAEYLFKGVTNKAFTRQFTLNDQIEVKGASMVNGILKVFLERFVPEHKKSRTIDIKDEETSGVQYLTENDL